LAFFVTTSFYLGRDLSTFALAKLAEVIISGYITGKLLKTEPPDAIA
jgi:hypothetical protein